MNVRHLTCDAEIEPTEANDDNIGLANHRDSFPWSLGKLGLPSIAYLG
jgi:hypothetical protein